MRAAVVALLSLGLLAACGDGDEVAGANAGTDQLDGEWRAVSATVDGVEVVGFDTVGVTMSIDGGRITGSGGCNEYDTPAEISDGTITFGDGAATEAACGGVADEIEALFYRLTSGSAEWSLDDGLLTLTTPTAVWVFE